MISISNLSSYSIVRDKKEITFLTTNIMNKIVKTASILTSGLIVGALVRRYALQGFNINRQSTIDSIKSVKQIFNRNNFSEDTDNYFV